MVYVVICFFTFIIYLPNVFESLFFAFSTVLGTEETLSIRLNTQFKVLPAEKQVLFLMLTVYRNICIQ